MQQLRTHAVASDDEFHPYDAGDWWATETLWFAFTVPERRLNCEIYAVFRPTIGTTSLHINCFDAERHEPWATPYSRSYWHLPLPPSLGALDMPEVDFSCHALEPLKRYAIHYSDAPFIAFDMQWTAAIPPQMLNGNHLDQYGRMRGELTLHGETIGVDCLQMRDRSWGKGRTDLQHIRRAYTYGIHSEGEAFHIMTAMRENEGEAHHGFIVRDGHVATLKTGRRQVLERGASGAPSRIRITAEDREGRRIEALGEQVAHTNTFVNGNIHGWASLTRWMCDGRIYWGEDQDVWSPQTWALFDRGVVAAGAIQTQLNR